MFTNYIRQRDTKSRNPCSETVGIDQKINHKYPKDNNVIKGYLQRKLRKEVQ
jgi:hypothetical protein